jgi:hypothetical protein
MIFAELHRKLGADYSRAHERAEDLLTSTVFGLLRYLPLADGLLAVLRSARPVRVVGEKVVIQPADAWLDLERVAKVEIDFWPYWPRYGEPDVLLTLWAADGSAVASVVIEAKLHAQKSGRASDDELADDAPDPDQLVRYWQGLQSGKAVQVGTETSVIYLTRHGAAPAEELAESVRRAPAMRLAWLSWRDVWEVAERLASRCPGNLVAADLARLLDHKGLKHFNGFEGKPWQTPSVWRFWRPAAWFAQAGLWCPGQAHASFWYREEGA